MDQQKIGSFIAELRTEQGLTQKSLAEKLGVSDKTVSKWECGRGLPEISLMIELSRQLGISINELLSGQRLDEIQYREKAEENMVGLMREKTAGKIVLHVLAAVLLYIFPIGTAFLVVGKGIPPEAMTVATFWCMLLQVANMVAGVTYGSLRKWKVWKIILMAAVDVALLAGMIIYFVLQLFAWFAL